MVYKFFQEEGEKTLLLMVTMAKELYFFFATMFNSVSSSRSFFHVHRSLFQPGQENDISPLET